MPAFHRDEKDDHEKQGAKKPKSAVDIDLAGGTPTVKKNEKKGEAPKKKAKNNSEDDEEFVFEEEPLSEDDEEFVFEEELEVSTAKTAVPTAVPAPTTKKATTTEAAKKEVTTTKMAVPTAAPATTTKKVTEKKPKAPPKSLHFLHQERAHILLNAEVAGVLTEENLPLIAKGELVILDTDPLLKDKQVELKALKARYPRLQTDVEMWSYGYIQCKCGAFLVARGNTNKKGIKVTVNSARYPNDGHHCKEVDGSVLAAQEMRDFHYVRDKNELTLALADLSDEQKLQHHYYCPKLKTKEWKELWKAFK
jgi:hypothetical protein